MENGREAGKVLLQAGKGREGGHRARASTRGLRGDDEGCLLRSRLRSVSDSDRRSEEGAVRRVILNYFPLNRAGLRWHARGVVGYTSDIV